VIFITHRIREAIEVTNRIVVLRKGLVVGEIAAGRMTPEVLSQATCYSSRDLVLSRHLCSSSQP